MTVSLKKSQSHFLRTPTCRENNTGTYKYSLLRTMSGSQPTKRTATSCQVTLPKACSWSNIFVSSRRCLRLFIRSPSALRLLVCSSVLSANEDSDFQKGQDDKKRRKLWGAWYSLWEVSMYLSYKQFKKNYTSHFLRIAAHFNTLQWIFLSPTLLVLAGLFWCFHNPSNSDMDCRIFNMCMWPFCRCIQMGDLYLGDLSL